MTDPRLTDLWPASALRISAGDLELRWIDDDLAIELALLAGRGVHADDAMPFYTPWTRGTPQEVARSVLAYQWRTRAELSPQRLALELGVLVDGIPVGVQGLSGNDWSTLQSAETGSWLGREHQGNGVGTRMRALMLHFAFEALGAQSITSAAFTDNPASNAISQRTGYEPDGIAQRVREGTTATLNRYRMTRVRWMQMREANEQLLGHPVESTGVTGLLTQLTPTA